MAYQPSPDRYKEMKYNRCGHSGLRLPALSLGLWHNFGGKDDGKAALATVQRAFDKGITHFDLANNYGPPAGSAEERFGKILKTMGHRDEMIISTKAGYYMWPGPYGDLGSRKYLLSSLDQSLSRMKIPYVDIFYHHRPDPETPLEETMGALASAVKQGKALYVGISNYKPEQAEKAIQILRQMGTPCLIHQPSYSMYNRWIEEGLLDVLGREGVGSIVFSPLAQGMLTNRYFNGVPQGSRATHSNFLKQDNLDQAKIEKSKKLDVIAKERGQTLAQMALAWVLRDKRVTTALIGASSPKQIDENVAMLKNPEFSPEELARIETILKGD